MNSPTRPTRSVPPNSRPATSSAPQNHPESRPQGRGSYDPQANAALFRVFRSIELNAVMEKLQATRAGENLWQLNNGDVIEISGQPGWQNWKVQSAQETKKGAVDLVVHVLNMRGAGQALIWLRNKFPEAEARVEEEKNKVSRQANGDPDAVDGGVRRSAPKKSGQQWSKEELDVLFDKYKNIRLSEVLQRVGADPNQDGDPSKWKMPGIGNIITKGQLWKNVQTEVDKGFGGVSFIKHAMNMDNQVQALKWMIKEFGEELGDDLIADDVETGPKDFNPPERFPDLNKEVGEYLVNERGLPSALVKEVLDAGSVYGSHPWNDARQAYLTRIVRCVFLGQASAELRDTDPDGFKGCCDGSQTDSSGFSVRPASQVPEFLVGLTEAAIDGLSYRALFPGRFAMSTNGAGRFLLQFRIAREALDRGWGVRLALDADTAGDLAAQKVFNAFYVRKALSYHLKLPEEQIDTWLVEGDMVIDVDKSPHHLFFNNGWKPELEVFEGRLVDTEKGVEKQWFSTNATAKPSIRLNIRKDLHERLRRGELTLTVSQKGFEHVTDTLNIKRDRPQHAKDWNEELKRLGASYSQAYDERARQGFSQGVPPLPAYLEKLRTPAAAEAAPAPRPNHPSDAQNSGGGDASSAPEVRGGRPARMRP